MRLLFVPVVAALFSACTTQEIVVAHSVPLNTAPAAYAESELLDVGVVIFESGVPEEEIDKQVLEELMREGTYPQIRRAESMYLAVELREALQRSRHWGAVWVTPSDSTALDLIVHGEILRSDGNFFALHVVATDATGAVWLDEDYDMETAASAYNRQRYPTQDPYQDVFNQIANDLALLRAGYDSAAIRDIRTVGELRYASELSPEAFGDYLEADRSGVYAPVRLPADGDPMLERARRVRQSEQLMFETLDQYYEDFSIDVTTSYDSWRQFTREDSIRIAEAARSAKLRTGLGALAMALSIAYGTQNDADSLTDMIIANSGMYIGNDLLRAASVKRQERRLHTQSMQELAEDFDDSAKPLVVEVRGTQHRLTGTTEAQFEEWQNYMRELFISETGFVPEEIQVYAEPAPAAPVPAAGEAATGDSAGDGSAATPGVIVPNAAADDSGEAIANGSGSAPAQV